MTDEHISFLLSMLHSIEAGQVNWPIQWLEGFVIALSKATKSHRATHYRRIVILSLIYRCWASIRPRQALMQLSNLVHEDAYGFIPQREASQVWYQVQAAVELAHQNNWDQIGLSTDVEKAFNMMKREPVFQVSAHLGLPERIIRPWRGFLARFRRRFQVHNQLSQAHLSNTGFPEGCPMSVTAMVILDWNMHIYMQCFCPLVRTISYVDNIILLSAQAFAIATAFCILQVYMELWGLSLDQDKSYSWGTTPACRSGTVLGIPLVKEAGELGGSLTFSTGRSMRTFSKRSNQAEPKWSRLARSAAAVLQSVFWAKSLHGCSGSILPENFIRGLRTKAMRSLGAHRAGASPIIRLSLAPSPLADPGFYQWIITLSTMRRLSRKSPDILGQWRQFQARYTGELYDGPFSKLVQQCSMMGWRILQPPQLHTQDDIEIDLIRIDHNALYTLAHDAWMQFVAVSVQHRQSLKALSSMDVELCRLDHTKLTPLELARTYAIQEGAFLLP